MTAVFVVAASYLPLDFLPQPAERALARGVDREVLAGHIHLDLFAGMQLESPR